MRGVIATIEPDNKGKLAKIVEQVNEIIRQNDGVVVIACKEVSEALPASGFNVWTVLRDSADISSLPIRRKHQVRLMRKHAAEPLEKMNEFVRQAAGILRFIDGQPPIDKSVFSVSVVTGSFAYAEAIREELSRRYHLPAENQSVCAAKRRTDKGEKKELQAGIPREHTS